VETRFGLFSRTDSDRPGLLDSVGQYEESKRCLGGSGSALRLQFAMPDLQQHAEDLDALTAAPQNHRLLFENEAVRVLDTFVRPGQTVPLHTHQWPSTNYLLCWSDFIRRDSDRAVLLDSRSLSAKPATGSAFWGPPLAPRTLENIGESDLHVITVELKYA